MKKSELKTGMFVKTDNDTLYMVVKRQLKSCGEFSCSVQGVIISNYGWRNLSDYDENLSSKSSIIVKVYEPPLNDIDGMYKDCNDNYLIWERKRVEWDKVEKDTKLYVKSYDGTDIPVFFAGYDERINEVEYYQFGATSWSNKRPVVKCHCEDVRLVED